MTQAKTGDGASSNGRKRKSSAADGEELRKKEEKKRRRLAREAEEARKKEELKRKQARLAGKSRTPFFPCSLLVISRIESTPDFCRQPCVRVILWTTGSC
jgi:hypothetical protein